MKRAKPDFSGSVQASDGSSLALKARDTLLRAILRQQFATGRLPAEDELARQVGVSRTTIRAALQSLEQHGLITRTPRRGTVVHDRMSPSLVALQRLISFGELLREQGHEVTYAPSLRTTTTPGQIVCETLGIADDAECYEIERLIYADGQPATWALDVFPKSSFVHPLEMSDGFPPSPFDMDQSFLVESIDHSVAQILPHLPGGELVTKLKLDPTEPCILLREVHFSARGTAIGFSAIHVNDRFVRFELLRQRGSL
jgi:GntR family transcriptional regulator